LAAVVLAAAACSVLEPPASLSPTAAPATSTAVAPPLASSTLTPTAAPATLAAGPRQSPTPDPPRAQVPEGLTAIALEIQPGEDLGLIAQRWGVSVDDLLEANGLSLDAVVYPGQTILVPQPVTLHGPALKIIPDSELVYGPASVGFDAAAFAAGRGGFLASYSEEVEGLARPGGELIQVAAERYSVNPRLLLALLEYQSGWVTMPTVLAGTETYPLGRTEGGTEGLFRQLEWAGNSLNAGFYGWREGRLNMLILGDGTRAGLAPGLNAGSAAVQALFAQVYGPEAWQAAVGPRGLAAAYRRLFGDPFGRAVEPLVPADLSQPRWELPWAAGETWYYSTGPHGGWGRSSAWAALDFLPPGNQTGCYVSPFWARAVAPGVIARSDYGLAVLDLDGDGNEQTGWTLLYLHLANDGRAEAGARLAAGDRVGRPSCDGGNSTGTHVHVARRFNGVWISPNVTPFVLGDWEARAAPGVQAGLGRLWQTATEVYKQPCDCRADGNALPREP
jgi:LysM repeat protein